MVSDPSLQELYQYYNDQTRYPWTEKALSGILEPLDLVRIQIFKDLVTSNDFRGKKVLDLGCGAGDFVKIAAGESKKVVGTDISRLAVSALTRKNHLPNVSYRCCAAEKLPFPGKSFDTVVCFEVLEHTKDPRVVLQEMNRILKDKGKLYVSVPNWFGWDRIKTISIFRKIFSSLSTGSHLHFYSPKDWQKIWEQENFRVIATRPIYIFPFIPDLPGIWGWPKKLERRIFYNKRIVNKFLLWENKLLKYWPFRDLGQSHLWVLVKL